ncbi:ferritin-like domain-containing protein [Peribacillus alkalitolerans]|uniref:ferritin-like domain-containing protein n=1 Tax=Peribacillus alkalitolerans TaxID=1550385 RepID=UPI0013D6D0FC|nr:ferritin-like domain-containing protein [Peribacillus alkalitolerans]
MTFLEKLQDSINNEWTAFEFYTKLMSETSNPLYIDFIKHARDDEKKHYESFQYLHYLITGKYHDVKPGKVEYKSFEEAIIIALKDELEAAETYRDMLFELPNQQAYQPLFVAMTDEMEHATRFSTIYGSLM